MILKQPECLAWLFERLTRSLFIVFHFFWQTRTSARPAPAPSPRTLHLHPASIASPAATCCAAPACTALSRPHPITFPVPPARATPHAGMSRVCTSDRLALEELKCVHLGNLGRSCVVTLWPWWTLSDNAKVSERWWDPLGPSCLHNCGTLHTKTRHLSRGPCISVAFE